RFIAKATGALVAAGAAVAIDAPNVIAQPKVQWRMSTTASPTLDIQRLCRIGIAAAIVFWSSTLAVHAQEVHRPFRIGVLNAAWAASHPTVEGLKGGLRALGLMDGHDVTFDVRFTEGKLDAMPAAAQALVKGKVDLIFTSQEAATQAAKEATKTIPIVFT